MISGEHVLQCGAIPVEVVTKLPVAVGVSDDVCQLVSLRHVCRFVSLRHVCQLESPAVHANLQSYPVLVTDCCCKDCHLD